MVEFESLINEYKETCKSIDVKEEEILEDRIVEILFVKDGAINMVKCEIKNLALHFVLDTGASSVSMSTVEPIFMLKNNYLLYNDITSRSNFATTTGVISECIVLQKQSKISR